MNIFISPQNLTYDGAEKMGVENSLKYLRWLFVGETKKANYWEEK